MSAEKSNHPEDHPTMLGLMSVAVAITFGSTIPKPELMPLANMRESFDTESIDLVRPAIERCMTQ